MGLFARLSTVSSSARIRADNENPSDPFTGLYNGYMPPTWFSSLSTAGIHVTPELAMTLAAVYSAVATISYDLATLPIHVFRQRDDGGKDRVRGSSGAGGIGSLAYLLRWQPNSWQTATEFLLSQVPQFLLRGVAYAEIVPGEASFVEQLVPRHPDRVRPERLPSGRLRYKLVETGGTPRYLTQSEMFVVRDLSLNGGLTPVSRVQAGSNAIGSALAAEQAAAKFFKSGMTAALVATYKGEKDDEDEDQLHRAITRYATGVDQSFGLMLIPDDVTIDNLGVEPEKAQMMLAREWGVREVARLFRLPGHKLGIKDSVGYNSQVQAALEYVINCLRPIAFTFEQAIQRDLILAKDTYFTEFKLEALLRGDPSAQAQFLEALVKNRIIRPSEARMIINMNPDPELDAISARDHQPGSQREAATDAPRQARAEIRSMLLVTEAMRCVRRERLAIEKLARKHADDPDGWQASLRDFYADHAGFIARALRLPMALARGYAAQHGSAFAERGLTLIAGEAGDAWERDEAEELAALALDAPAMAA